VEFSKRKLIPAPSIILQIKRESNGVMLSLRGIFQKKIDSRPKHNEQSELALGSEANCFASRRESKAGAMRRAKRLRRRGGDEK